jgi:hypothetical protein
LWVLALNEKETEAVKAKDSRASNGGLKCAILPTHLYSCIECDLEPVILAIPALLDSLLVLRFHSMNLIKQIRCVCELRLIVFDLTALLLLIALRFRPSFDHAEALLRQAFKLLER